MPSQTPTEFRKHIQDARLTGEEVDAEIALRDTEIAAEARQLRKAIRAAVITLKRDYEHTSLSADDVRLDLQAALRVRP